MNTLERSAHFYTPLWGMCALRCGSPVATSAAGRSTDRGDSRDANRLDVCQGGFSSLHSVQGFTLALHRSYPNSLKPSAPAGGIFMSKGGNMTRIEEQIRKTEQELRRESRRLARLKNRKTYYESGERQKRAHRLITRGAAVENIAPSVKDMSEVEFYDLAEKIFALPEVKNLIAREVN